MLDSATHDLFRLALCIALGAVEEIVSQGATVSVLAHTEEIYTSVVCSFEACKRVVVANVAAVG